MHSRIAIAIAELQLADALFDADKKDKRIVSLLTDAAGLIAKAIADAQNPVGPLD